MIVRRLRAADSAALLVLCQSDTRASRYYPNHTAWLRRAIEDLSKPGRTVFGAFSPTPGNAEFSTRLDACVFLKLSDFDDSAELKNLVVRPAGAEVRNSDVQFEALARSLLEKAIRHCEVREIGRLEIELPQEEHYLI